MSRVKRGVQAHARHKKVLDAAKGHRGRRSTCYRVAVNSVEKARQYAYRDRRTRRRDLRALWIQRINAGVRAQNWIYSQFMHALDRLGILLDRKSLSYLAAQEPEKFSNLVKSIKEDWTKSVA